MQPELSTASLPDSLIQNDGKLIHPYAMPMRAFDNEDAEVVIIIWLIRRTPCLLFIPFHPFLCLLERFNEVQGVKFTAIIYFGCWL